MFYRDSKGVEHVISEMNPMKLLNAYKAMKRDGWNPEKFDSQEEHDRALEEMGRQVGENRAAYRVELVNERPNADPERQAKIDEILANMDLEDHQEAR